MKPHNYLVCVENTGYEVSLERRKLYETLPDKEGERHGQVRVVDESGEDYLFPADLFARVSLPMETRKRIVVRAA